MGRCDVARIKKITLMALAALLAPALRASAQVPQPHIADTTVRSGLISRFDRIESHLPPDTRRDTWYHTRWGDKPHGHRPNSIKEGGMYGHLLRANCTASIYPYFLGSPGKSSITCDCYPWPRPLRTLQGFIKPFKPVGMYYDQGSYVPVHDLDPLVPGPGALPFPWYYNPARGG